MPGTKGRPHVVRSKLDKPARASCLALGSVVDHLDEQPLPVGSCSAAMRDLMLRVDTLREFGRWWAGSADPTLPVISPAFGDPRGLLPIRIYQGTDDLLLLHARLLRSRVVAAGGSAQPFEFDGAYDGFVGALSTPEAKEVFADVGQALHHPAAAPSLRKSEPLR
jgi:acetyl esterase/lipase